MNFLLPQALASAKSPEAAAALLNCSKQNIHVLMGNLEFELGRFVMSDDLNGRAASTEDGKLKLVHYAQKEWQLTPAGLWRCNLNHSHTSSSIQLGAICFHDNPAPSECHECLSSDVQLSAGRLLQRYSHRLIALAADALVAMRDLQNVKTGQMSVAASQTTGVYLMPPLIGELPPVVVFCPVCSVCLCTLVHNVSNPGKLSCAKGSVTLACSFFLLLTSQVLSSLDPQSASRRSTGR